MKFSSYQVTGKGRGKLLGIPTINLQIPGDFDLEEGIHAVRVQIENQLFTGALHFGPVPVFKSPEKSLEVLLIDVSDENLPETFGKKIEIEVIRRLRDIRDFESPEEMVEQIKKDVEEVKNLLSF